MSDHPDPEQSDFLPEHSGLVELAFSDGESLFRMDAEEDDEADGGLDYNQCNEGFGLEDTTVLSEPPPPADAKRRRSVDACAAGEPDSSGPRSARALHLMQDLRRINPVNAEADRISRAVDAKLDAWPTFDDPRPADFLTIEYARSFPENSPDFFSSFNHSHIELVPERRRVAENVVDATSSVRPPREVVAARSPTDGTSRIVRYDDEEYFCYGRPIVGRRGVVFTRENSPRLKATVRSRLHQTFERYNGVEREKLRKEYSSHRSRRYEPSTLASDYPDCVFAPGRSTTVPNLSNVDELVQYAFATDGITANGIGPRRVVERRALDPTPRTVEEMSNPRADVQLPDQVTPTSFALDRPGMSPRGDVGRFATCSGLDHVRSRWPHDGLVVFVAKSLNSSSIWNPKTGKSYAFALPKSGAITFVSIRRTTRFQISLE